MIPVDHTLVNAYFTDNEKSIVCTEWQSNTEDEAFRTYTFNVDENNRWWRALLKHHIDIEQIHENTYNRIRNMRQTYENELKEIAIANNEWDDIFGNRQADHDLLIKYINTGDGEKDVFNLKLKLFEQEHVFKSNNRELKSELRKAKTIADVLKAYLKF